MKHRNITRATLALSLTAMLAVTSGCATMGTGIDNATQKVGGIFGSQNGNTKAATGGAILGCAAGAIAGKLFMGGSSMLKACAAGAVIGGVASVKYHEHLLAEAQKTAAEANAVPGVKATVATRQIEATNDQGQKEQTTTFDKLELNLPASKVAAHSDDLVRVITKADTLADAAKQPTTITVLGTLKERVWLTSEVRAHLVPNSTVKVAEEPAAKPELVISPVPQVQ